MRPMTASILLGATVLAAAAAALLLRRPPADEPLPAPADATAAQRWYALNLEERAALVARYRSITGEADGVRALRRAGRFAREPADEQAKLRLVYEALAQILREQPEHRRRLLVTLPERARADEVHRILARDYPTFLAELRERLQAPG